MLRERIAKLSTASLRISASLDLDTVLSEVVESARALTGARYGGIVTGGDRAGPSASSLPDSRPMSTGNCGSGATGRGYATPSGIWRAR